MSDFVVSRISPNLPISSPFSPDDFASLIERVAQEESSNLTHWQNLLDELNSLKNDEYDEEFLAPTKYAYDLAQSFLDDAFRLYERGLPTPNIIPNGEGGIRLEWISDSRELRLICPSQNDKPAYIYYQEGNEYSVETDATPSMLITRLDWLTEL